MPQVNFNEYIEKIMDPEDRDYISCTLNDIYEAQQELETLEKDVEYYQREMQEAQELVDDKACDIDEMKDKLFSDMKHIDKEIIEFMDWESGENVL